MSTDWVGPTIGAVLGTGGLAALVSARSKNRKTDAEADGLDADTLIKITNASQVVMEAVTQELRVEVDRVVTREHECRAELAQVRLELSGVRLQMSALQREMSSVRVNMTDLSEKVDDQGTSGVV